MTSTGETSIYIILAAAGAAGYLVLFFFAWSIIKYYKDSRERDLIATITGSLAIATPLFILFMVPLDVHVVSYNLNDVGGQLYPATVATVRDALHSVYVGCFGFSFFLFFLALPVCYFMLEDHNEDVDFRTRSKSSAKFILMFAGLFCVLAFMGSILREDQTKDPAAWRRALAQDFSVADSYVSFVVGSVALLGSVGWGVYMSFGIAEFPFMLVRSRGGEFEARTVEYDEENIDQQLQQNAREQNYLRSRYNLPQRKWPRHDRQEYKRLQQEEQRLKQRKENLVRPRGGEFMEDEGDTFWNSLIALRVLLCIVVGLVGSAMWVSMMIATIDVLSHSICGGSCGYLLEVGELFNPLDQALLASEDEFPLDFFLFTSLLLYLTLALVLGVITINSYWQCAKFQIIERQRGMVHSLVMMSWQMHAVLMAMVLQLNVLCPTYAMFGKQFYVDELGDKHACTLDRVFMADSCVPTRIAQFASSLASHFPVFNTVAFFSNFLFSLCFLLSVAWAIKRKGKRITPNIRQGAFLFDSV